jgi:SAM-dependent methyltransferase
MDTTATATPVTPEVILQLASGYMASKMLFAAGAIDLFAQLADGPLSPENVAARMKLPLRSVRVVADAMVALGLLTLDAGRYSNTDVAQTYLSGRTPADMRPLLKFWDRLSYPAWQRLDEAVRNDGKKEDTLFDLPPEQSAIFSAGVEAATAGGALALAASYDFSRHTRALDLGGGTGSFLKIIRRQHPHLEGTLFELPTTAAFARSRLSASEARHIAVVEGDLLADAFPTGHDVMLLAHILHGFDEPQNLDLLKRAHAASTPGGRLLIVDFLLDPTRTSPVLATLISGEFLVQTLGRSYSAAEVSEWLGQTGWRTVEHRPLAGPVSVLVAER